jgi:hypothetical protein
MLKKPSLRAVAGLLALVFATPLFAGGRFWDFLGYTQVDSSKDHGSIQITRHDIHFHTIQLRVSGEAIFFDRLIVHFADGTLQELMVSEQISPGERNYDLLDGRFLESVELWYYKEPRGHNPRVSLYGVHSPEDDRPSIAHEN